MLKATIHKLYTKVRSNKLANRVFEVLEKTPAHALHWYVLLAVGFIFVVISVLSAWGTFFTRSSQDEGLRATNTATINQADLKESLEMYRLKTETFDTIKGSVPTVVDPGR